MIDLTASISKAHKFHQQKSKFVSGVRNFNHLDGQIDFLTMERNTVIQMAMASKRGDTILICNR
jgi:hypothetical protein